MVCYSTSPSGSLLLPASKHLWLLCAPAAARQMAACALESLAGVSKHGTEKRKKEIISDSESKICDPYARKT